MQKINKKDDMIYPSPEKVHDTMSRETKTEFDHLGEKIDLRFNSLIGMFKASEDGKKERHEKLDKKMSKFSEDIKSLHMWRAMLTGGGVVMLFISGYVITQYLSLNSDVQKLKQEIAIINNNRNEDYAEDETESER